MSTDLSFLNGSPVAIKAPGVYAIVQKESRLTYVGQSSNMHLRMTQHKSDLRCGRHSNADLQSLWNEHGEEGFLFVVVKILANKGEREKHEEEIARVLKEHGLCIANVTTVSRRLTRKARGMPKSAMAERQQALRDARKKAGLILVRIWATKKQAKAIRAAAEAIKAENK